MSSGEADAFTGHHSIARSRSIQPSPTVLIQYPVPLIATHAYHGTIEVVAAEFTPALSQAEWLHCITQEGRLVRYRAVMVEIVRSERGTDRFSQ